MYLALKTLHIVSSTILFGTGLGTASFMLMAERSRDRAAIAVVTRVVVKADLWLTTVGADAKVSQLKFRSAPTTSHLGRHARYALHHAAQGRLGSGRSGSLLAVIQHTLEAELAAPSGAGQVLVRPATSLHIS
nr:DUF2269 family protein [Variovorax boronicumulans]